MILFLSVRQTFIVVMFGIAAIFELICAWIILKRDRKYCANRFTSIAYLSLSLSLSISIIYVLITDSGVISFFHRLANILNLITVMFLFLAAMYISEGSDSLKSYRFSLIGVDSMFGLLLLISPGITIVQITPFESIIKWSIIFLLGVIIPLYTTLIFCCYYYMKVWTAIPDSKIKKACFFITLGTAIFGFSHFCVIFPLWMRSLTEAFNATLFTLTGSIGVLIASLLITLGYNTKISKTSI